ncbi:MAG: transporter [Sporolactobacillus laevolacticus]|nr:transporter [Sporolactobacillus laevolacticus]
MIIINYMILCLIFGTTFLAIKIGVDAGTPPFFSAGVRFFLAGMLLFIWMLWRKEAKLSLLLRKELWFIGLGLTFSTFAALYWAEQYVSSGMAAVLSATGPMIIIIIQVIASHKKITASSLIGCAIGFVGVFMLILPNLTVKSDGYEILGCIIILLGETGYAAATVYSKQVNFLFSTMSPITLNAVQMICGGTALIVLSLFTEKINFSSLFTGNTIGSLLYLTIIGSMIGHTIYYWLVVRTNPIFPSTWLYVSPIIALIIGHLIYKETVSSVSIIGSLTIISGVVIANAGQIRSLIRRPKLE